MKSYKEAGRGADLESYLQRLIARDASLTRDLAYAAVIGNLTDSATLSTCVERFVFEHAVLASLVNADELKTLPDDQRRRAIDRIAQGLRQVAASSARYRCGNCGYSTQRFIWHCPSCKLWETIRPIQTFALENVLS
jgi:lipopolysaccharide biosynthesis regulator YciM